MLDPTNLSRGEAHRALAKGIWVCVENAFKSFFRRQEKATTAAVRSLRQNCNRWQQSMS